MPFQSTLPQGLFDVTMSAAAIVKEVGGMPPATIIRTDQAWSVEVEWDVTGIQTGWIAGQWHLHIYLEKLGPGDDLVITDPNEVDIPLIPQPYPETVHYHYHPDVKPGAVPEGEYKLVVSLTYTDATGHLGEMSGFWEGPMLQFYKA